MRSELAIVSYGLNAESSTTTVARYWQSSTGAMTAERESQVAEIQQRDRADSKSTIISSLAALGSVVAASSCCLPILPFLFAAGAAGTSAFFIRFRPYLLVLSVLLIAFGFYQSWKAKQCNRRPSRISVVLLWLSAIVVFVFIFFPQVVANLVADLLAGKS